MVYTPKMTWYFDGNSLIWIVLIAGKIYARDANLETAKQWALQKWQAERDFLR